MVRLFKRNYKKSILSWVIAFAIVIASISYAGKSQAAQTDPAAIGTTSPAVKAHFKAENVDGSYHEYYVTVENGLSTNITDWLIAVPMNNVSSVQDWTSFSNYQTYYTSNYLYIAPIKGGTIAANSTYGSFTDGNSKINYSGFTDCSDSSAIVYYVTGGSASFSDVIGGANGPSSGGGNGGGGNSAYEGNNIGTVDTSKKYNFAKLLQLSLYFYDANMCGKEVEDHSLYSSSKYNGWRGNCHSNDSFTYGGRTYEAWGGYHDAGDHVKFGLPMAEAMTMLGVGYQEFGDAYDELGQTGHLKTILDYYCDYVKRCTVLNSSGAVEAFCYQVGDGVADHQSWTSPEVDPVSRAKTYIATSSNPSTDIVSETAAALAMNYLNFGNEEDLTYAKKLFEFAKNNTKKVAEAQPDGYGGHFYRGSSWKDDYTLAAALLYKITKSATYLTEVNTNLTSLNGDLSKPLSWDDVSQAAIYYSPENSSYVNTAKSWINGIANSTGSSYYWYSEWGSARYNCNAQMMALVFDRNTYKPWSTYQMSLILGGNSTGKNMVCGYNADSPKHPHHRAASGFSNGWSEFGQNATQAYTLYGALAGGPETSDFSSFEDKVNNYYTCEVTLDYNACMTGAAAALYLLHKNDTEEMYSEQTILKGFYGGSEFAGGSSGTTPTAKPTTKPTVEPTLEPGATPRPTGQPTTAPTAKPTLKPGETPRPGDEDNQDPEVPGGDKGPILSPSLGAANAWNNVSYNVADSFVTNRTSDVDVPGALYGKCQLRAGKVTKNSITLKWNKVAGVEGYAIYASKCGNANKLVRLGNLGANATSFQVKNLKKKTYYKYMIVTFKRGSGGFVTTGMSKIIHVITKGGKYGDPTGIKVKKSKLTVTIHKSAKIKAKIKKKAKKMKTHRKLCYESDNPTVASVNNSGKITGVGKGKCSIFIYAQNGICKKITVTVK